MKTSVQKWHEVTEPYRAEAWQECTRIVRALVDRDPHDLSTRALLASLLLRSEERELALLQYERLLPLAVGQGDLLRALGAQRRLDDLQPPAARHPDRYRAMQDWFGSLGYSRAGCPDPKPRRGSRSAAAMALFRLPAESLTQMAEQMRLCPLGLSSHAQGVPGGAAWIVFFGRVEWAIVQAETGARTEFVAEEGDVIHLPSGPETERLLEVTALSPAEVMQFEPGVAGVLTGVEPAGD
jgi:hypothetical protein